MRAPKKQGKKKKAPKAPAEAAAAAAAGAPAPAGGSSGMDTDQPGGAPAVWRPGLDPLGEDEELDYDPTAYDCLHRFALEWPCLSFDILRDGLGGPRAAFPHTVFMAAGTQAAQARQNHIALLKLAALGQGRHGKRDGKRRRGGGSDSGSDSGSELIQQSSGVNRIRAMPQRPGVLAVWNDNRQVRILDAGGLLAELEAEEALPVAKPQKVTLNPLASHTHAMEGFALGWSPAKAGRLASGDCKRHLHVWEPAEGGGWAVSGVYNGHEDSVEDIAWSPSEETVLASCGVDKTVRIWDTRERGRSMLSVAAHDADVNVVSWSGLVTYMLASGCDDGSLRIWDLRSFKDGGFVSHFAYHKGAVTSVEWSPYESSMLATSGSDNAVAVWDLALERDPEEEAALAPEGNAVPQEDLPAQLLFVHAGQSDVKELHWHAQIPGMIGSTAADGFNLFRPSNL
ncbi:MAG: WD40-repeat-containing domain protein [Monoraphidium minutum]|nr:MAG: WD40-repeat-containing domain protein [Monoraphidium minutum]